MDVATTKGRNIPLNTRRRLRDMPCVICGDAVDIEIDHIVPVSQGGGNEESNLQPLCHQCHMRKGRGKGRSNAELVALYLADPEEHHRFNRYRMSIRYKNYWDAPDYHVWVRTNA